MPIICIAGPTASGKSALAINLAQAISGEIVSCDSMQVYRRMDIGTAKPTQEEMRRVPHHMIDVAEPEEDYSVGQYCTQASCVIEDILSRGKNPIIVGGTGLYMDSLIRGNTFLPRPATDVREKLESQADTDGMDAMLSVLRSIDPDSAQRLHAADRKRILRALEVYYETGMTITEHNLRTQAIPPRYNPIWFALDFSDRSQLYSRIDLRVIRMLDLGLLNEIKALLYSGVSPSCTSMQAIGYKEFIPVFDGTCSLQTAVAQVQQSTRRYAKRQLTWFRRNRKIHWLTRNVSEPAESLLPPMLQIIAENLS